MSQDVRTQINHLMLVMMQDFLELQMKNAYQDNWMNKVYELATNKVINNDHKVAYEAFYNRASTYGLATLAKTDMDITLVTALLTFDFVGNCKVGTITHFRNHVKAIREDKNEYISHNSNMQDVLWNRIKGLVCLRDLKEFLKYLASNNWNTPGKVEYLQKYEEEVESVLQNYYKELSEAERAEIDLQSCLNVYMRKLNERRAEQKQRYVPLTYRKADSSQQYYELKELMETNKSLVITADAGYGKSWSLVEMAGQLAEAYCQDTETQALPILIEMGMITTHSAKPLRERINDICFYGKLEEDELENFLREKKLVLFVDGMDEAKGAVADDAAIEIKDFYENYSNIRIIGGTRADYRNRYPGKLTQFHICNLSDGQLEQFIKKFVKPEYVETAIMDWITNDKSFYTNLKTPFYITCYCEAINGGRRANNSFEVVEFCLDEMIKREISKGFKASERLINEVLCSFCDELQRLEEQKQREVSKMPDKDLRELLEKSIRYDIKQNAAIAEILDSLVEMQILRYFDMGKRYYIGFAQEQYRRIYSPEEGFFD